MPRSFPPLLALLMLLPMTGCRNVRVDPAEQLATYDAAPYATVLDATVRDGLVDYGCLGTVESDLNRYLDALDRFGPRSTPELFPTEEDRLAYYLNAYNALMLRRWLDAGADNGRTNRSVNVFWFFGDQWAVDQGRVSLDHLEQQIIRKRFDEPRIHFALVCGAIDCPPLLEEPFEGARLDEQLESLGVRWLQEPDSMRLNEDGDRLLVSHIFKWYGKDFRDDGGLRGIVERYVPDDDPRKESFLGAIDRKRIRYRGYDWSINAFPESACVSP